MDLTLSQSLAGLPGFFAYFGTGLCLLVLFLALYGLVTPYHELALIREGNVAAAISLAGATLGFTLPLASVIAHAVSLPDMFAWSVVALVVQVAVYFVVARAVPRFGEAIRDGRVAAATLLASVSIAVGMLNAASLTY